MRKLTKLIFLGLIVSFGTEAQIRTPAPSPAGSVSSTIGLTDVTINYSRPKVKGRKIFGDGDDFLQPYGTLWRAGANAGTTITLSTAANIAGTDVEAGTYMILAVPGNETFDFILYSDPSIGGNMSAVQEDKKLLTAKVKNVKQSTITQSLTFGISDISDDNTSANIYFAWADASFKVPIKVSFDDIIMKDIAAKTQVSPGNYMAAANYYVSAGKDLNQALEWVNKYLAIEGNSKQFWNVFTKAEILAKLGKNKEAMAVAQECIATAKANEGGDFGYVKRSEDLIAKAKGK